jgi:Ca-activated chloride channel family protein
MSIDRDNPKWTAYVLGELDASERAALESELESSEEAREFVQELRVAALMMKDGLAAHADATLTPEQRFSIQAASSASAARPQVRRWFGRALAWTGGLAAAAVVIAAISIPSLLRSRQAAIQPQAGIQPVVNSAALDRTEKTFSEAVVPAEPAFQDGSRRAVFAEKQVNRQAAKDSAANAQTLTAPAAGVGVGFGASLYVPPAAAPATANETIAGVVTDSTKAVIPGVTVTATNLQTGATAIGITNESGKYELKNLADGEYKVTAELPGFKTGVVNAVKKEKDLGGVQGQGGQQGQQGQQNQPASADFKLQVANTSQSVEVTVAADTLLSASSASLGTVRSAGAPRDLPLVGNNVLSMVEVRPGIGAAPPPPPPASAARAAAPTVAPTGLLDRPDAFDTASQVYENSFISATQQPVSTFSVDVDTASYANMRRFLNQNQLPPRDSVRIEEMINYFTYDYPQAAGGQPVTGSLEVAAAPWNPQHRLVRVGVKAKDVRLSQKPSNLVFLIDVSGSMGTPERLPLLKSGLHLLVDKLTESDRVSIVTYAGSSGIALQPISGDRKDVILRAIDNLRAEGSTNGGAGIQTAYQLAVANFIRGSVNRVILATDGDFNVGVTDPNQLTQLIEDRAKSGVFLTVLGFGNNFKDTLLGRLAQKGHGNYAFVDTINEAKKVLSEQLDATLVAVAKDVKIQVEFNPGQINAYRLLGYEARLMRAQDFNNDQKDANDMGSGQTVTALYEVVPRGVNVNGTNGEPLRYQPEVAVAAQPRGGRAANEMLDLRIRYKEPEGTESKLIEVPLVDRGASFASASSDFRFASAVAGFGLVLRDSSYKGSATLDWVLATAQNSRGGDKNGYREEFIRLVQRSMQIRR